jgi:hypothetical protein
MALKPGDIANDFFPEEALHFYQARDDAKTKTGDKGIIERMLPAFAIPLDWCGLVIERILKRQRRAAQQVS